MQKFPNSWKQESTAISKAPLIAKKTEVVYGGGGWIYINCDNPNPTGLMSAAVNRANLSLSLVDYHQDQVIKSNSDGISHVSIRRFNLSGHGVAALSQCKHLDSLLICDTEITHELVTELARLKNLKCLCLETASPTR